MLGHKISGLNIMYQPSCVYYDINKGEKLSDVEKLKKKVLSDKNQIPSMVCVPP